MPIPSKDSVQRYSQPEDNFRRSASIVEAISDNVANEIKDKFKTVKGLRDEDLKHFDSITPREAVELFSVFPLTELNKVSIVRSGSKLYLAHSTPVNAGGFGIIYKAYDMQMQRSVAFKVPIVGSRDNIDSLKREAQAHANEEHKNIVKVYNLIEGAISSIPNLDSQSFIVMEYMDPNESKTLEKLGELNPEQAINIIKQVCEAISFLAKKKKRKRRHLPFIPAKDLLEEEISQYHHDINPGNIFVGSDGVVKISDFGIADTVYKSTDGNVKGSPHYMNPESIKDKKADIRSELFSLTSVIYKKITNVDYYAPRVNQSLDILIAVLNYPYTRMTQQLEDYCNSHNLDKNVVHDFFLKGWDKNIDKRFQTAKEYSLAFEKAFSPH